ncbi:MAG: heterodisulfide reductase-related iron-sulfur binding cluster, partial [Phycisphaerales bacterium JB038]
DPKALRERGLHWEGSATYHYSCHLRGIGMRDEAAQLADSIDGLDFRSLDKIDQCCGFGGTFCLKYPTISGAMTREKVECVRETGAKTLIVNDPGCAMNLAGACRRQAAQVEVKSLAEILAEGLGLLPKEPGLA